jgi:LPXTG-motif cell wall-anchored protein
MVLHLPILQAGPDTLTAIAILVVAIGLVGLAILLLFSRKKI